MKIGIERNKFPPCPLRPTLSSSIHSKLLIQLHHNHGPFSYFVYFISAWMQNGLQFLCHWIHGIQKQPIIRRNCGTARSSQIRNVVFMGMGEPLNNYSAVVEAVGIIHAINKLHNDLSGLNLAVSLHAPAQDIRCQIMPAARAFPLGKLMDSLQDYQSKSLQKIFIEYIMLDGFKPTSEQNVSNFHKILWGTYHIRTTVRKQMGQDISGACGQLVVNIPDKSLGNAVPLTDIEDLVI
ncbi:Dual-specificity RNA methyltransferase RlmN [Glycine max]|nr:Dual-specificity RNA methyltransferase RlmN [Glycine max]